MHENPLTQWRKERGYTQTDCAIMVGVAAQTWRNYEHGLHLPGENVMAQLRAVIGPDIEHRLGEWYSERRRKMLEYV